VERLSIKVLSGTLHPCSSARRRRQCTSQNRQEWLRHRFLSGNGV